MGVLPPLTAEQRDAALQKAVLYRTERAAVKDRLKRGTATLAEIIEATTARSTMSKAEPMGEQRRAQLYGYNYPRRTFTPRQRRRWWHKGQRAGELWISKHEVAILHRKGRATPRRPRRG